MKIQFKHALLSIVLVSACGAPATGAAPAAAKPTTIDSASFIGVAIQATNTSFPIRYTITSPDGKVMVESASKTRLHMVSALKAGVLETIAIDGDFYVKEGAGAWKQLIKGNPAEVAKALVESAAFSLEDVNKDLKTQKVTDKGLVKFGERSTLQYAYGAGKNEINIFIGANDGRLVRMEFPSGAGSVGWEYPATLAITAPAIQ